MVPVEAFGRSLFAVAFLPGAYGAMPPKENCGGLWREDLPPIPQDVAYAAGLIQRGIADDKGKRVYWGPEGFAFLIAQPLAELERVAAVVKQVNGIED